MDFLVALRKSVGQEEAMKRMMIRVPTK